MMIDYEEGRISVRLSEGTFYTLQKDAENFCFLNNDGSCNENKFYNCILPALHQYRMIQRERLRERLEKRFSYKVKPEYKNEIFEELDDVFNAVLFEDKGIETHETKLTIRLSKENIKIFSPYFSILKLQQITKSSYIRNLLNEYASMRTDEREHLCFETEYNEVYQVIDNCDAVEYRSEILHPITIHLCRHNNEFYVIGIVRNDSETFLKSYRLCEFKNYKITYPEFEIDDELLQKVDPFIKSFEYYEKPVIPIL